MSFNMIYQMHNSLKKISLLLMLLPLLMSEWAIAKSDYAGRDDVQAFARHYAQEHDKSYQEVMNTLSQGAYKQ